jgi:hypothetical protein
MEKILDLAHEKTTAEEIQNEMFLRTANQGKTT